MITVFTPTYNRANKLQRLYQSLREQTNYNFEWLIIDDGSSDNTEQVVESFIEKESQFLIRYFKKKNGGKYTAHNEGVKKANGDLFLCVDSDDYIEETAIDELLKCWHGIKEESCTGVIALKKDQNNKILSESFPENVERCKKIDLEQKYKCKGEFTLVFKTTILKQYLYPLIEGEKFMGESIVYDQVDQIGEMCLLNKVITVCKYCDDGYTHNFMKVVLNNPTGYQIYYKQRIDLAVTFKEKIGYIVRYHAFRIMSKEYRFEYDGNSRMLVKAMLPLGYLAYLLYERKKKL